ncbi:MAG TPA: hypothetical protein VEW03_11855 [Longimicrobiaceae bacterium]|nr:hypothetical protein [Longimicrobiaceae bacterium]
MLSGFRTLLAGVCAAIALAACAPGASSGPGEPEPEPDVAWSASSDPDSIATWALRRCRWGGLDARRNCVERALGALIEPAGIGQAMAVLDRIAARDGAMLNESHGLAHGLGIAAYRTPETVAQTFAACPPTQISGCYHGVVQGYFLDVARREGQIGTAEMNALCEPHRPSVLLFFQCTHGMGHGVMAVLANHVPASLELCDLVTDPSARDSCYGGVFMENIVAATHPEHTAQSHAEVGGVATGHGADGEHAGHTDAAPHAAAAPREPWKQLDTDDPLYPCTVVEHKYRNQCYLIQTGAMLFFNRGDFARTANDCTRAPEQFVPICWRSLGRDITAFASRIPSRTAEMCARAGATAEPDCIRGAAESLVNVSSQPSDGFALCRVAAESAGKAGCYEAVARTVGGLIPDPARREEACAAVEPAYVEPCRRAAGLPPVQQVQTLAWRAGPSIRGPRDHHVVFSFQASGGSYLYVAGGTDYRQMLGGVLRSRLAADGTPGPWTEVAQLPAPLAGASAAVVGSRVVLTGGQVAADSGMRGLRRVAETYVASIAADGSLGAWTPGPALPAPRFHHPSVHHGGWVYIPGGQGATAADADVFAARVGADGAPGEWQRMRPLPRARSHHAALVHDGHLYVVGGLDGDPAGHAALYTDVLRAPIAADGTLGEWRIVGRMPHAYATHSAFVHDGALWVLGGVEDNLRFVATVWRAPLQPNGSVGAWQEVGPGLPVARGHVHQTPVIDGRVYSIGGRIVPGADGMRVTDLMVFGSLQR